MSPGDRYAKTLNAWDHLVVMIFAQLSGAMGLRSLAAEWNAHAHHHYHLGSGPVARSTLADANGRRNAAIPTFEAVKKFHERHQNMILFSNG